MVFLSRAIKPFCIFLVLVMSGCVVAQKLGLTGKSVRFSHKTHVTDEEMDCVDCHLTVEDEAAAGMPRMGQCMACHRGIDEDLPEKKRPLVVFGKKPVWSSVTDIPEENIFSHQKHGEAGVDCAECHPGIETSARITGKVRVAMDACTKCHAKKKAANECETCHREIRKDREPPDHKHNWKRYHGQAARADSGKTSHDCSLCHQESTCDACHQDEAPQNHNNHWRHRGHGIAASLDRDNCSVCHRSDSCDRCHRDTSPRNHTGLWASPRNTHCTSCHFPLNNEGCATCHQATPSHATADALPTNAAHTNATDTQCRECHTPANTGHLDNGDSCRLCHQ